MMLSGPYIELKVMDIEPLDEDVPFEKVKLS